jgi:hypothetical protein
MKLSKTTYVNYQAQWVAWAQKRTTFIIFDEVLNLKLEDYGETFFLNRAREVAQ